MDDGNENDIQQEEQPQSTTQVLECGKCHQKFMALQPKPEIVNLASFSAVIWPHDSTQDCPHCGECYAPFIAKFQYAMQWTQVPSDKRVKLIQPPAGMRVS